MGVRVVLSVSRGMAYDFCVSGIIASKRCNNVEIYDNEVYNGGAQAAGIFLHRSTDSAKVYGERNGGASRAFGE